MSETNLTIKGVVMFFKVSLIRANTRVLCASRTTQFRYIP